jgi:hypothetical protein
LGLVGTWWSGQEHRVLSGIDGMLFVVVVGEGKLVVPLDFAIRRPDSHGPGAPCRDKLHWLQGMLDGRFAAFRRRGVALPPPMVVADSWYSDSKLMRLVATTHGGQSSPKLPLLQCGIKSTWRTTPSDPYLIVDLQT